MEEKVKKKTTFWLPPDMIDRMDGWLKADNCRSRNEFVEKARGGGLFKVDVPQAFEEIAVFNNSKKCSLSSGDFRRKTCIFCAAVVNEKAS